MLYVIPLPLPGPARLYGKRNLRYVSYVQRLTDSLLLTDTAKNLLEKHQNTVGIFRGMVYEYTNACNRKAYSKEIYGK